MNSKNLLLALLFSSAVIADEVPIPKFKGTSQKYLNQHENCALSGSREPGKEWECTQISDELIIGDLSDEN